MGSCLTRSQKQGQNIRVVRNIDTPSTMNSAEIHLLKLMFNDLASRSGFQKVSRDDFDVFFHLNGLWGQQIFRYFDPHNRNQLTFEDFKLGIEKLVKGSLKQRVHALFSFYDTGRTNSICYFDLITMMFSYQKDQLKKIIDDEKFIATLDSKQKQYHFGRSSDGEKQVIEEIQTEHSSNTHSQKTYNLELESKKSSTSNRVSTRHSSKPLQRKSSGSISYFDALSKRNIKIASNVSMMVRKYVDFLFGQLNLEKETDAMTEDQFTYLISKHQQIFNSYYEGFHNYIWETDQNSKPLSKQMPSWISSACVSYDPETGLSNKIYMKYIRSTIFIYKFQDDKLPREIINLEGLQLEQLEQDGKTGFLLKHSYGYYPQKHYLFTQESMCLQWMKHLAHMRSTSFHEKYRLMQKIGRGNFSTVYRGIDKKSRAEVAVKVIQKQKLSNVENYIIRHECEVLQLCHHPCIVNFKQKIQSKTHIFLITQLLTDGDLYDYIYQKKTMNEKEASFVMKQLLQTVQYLDALGLIHRDIKPQNIIIRKHNNSIQRVKLIDFGFAVFKNSLDTMKKCEKFAGTPGYSAPQIIRLESYDSSVDNFSLGVLLHFMLSGTLPFDSERNEQIKKLTLQGKVEMKGQVWESVSEQAKDLVLKLLRPSGQRISVEQALVHPWIQNQQLRVSGSSSNS